MMRASVMIKTSKNGVKTPGLNVRFLQVIAMFLWSPSDRARARSFPETSTVFEAVEQTRKLYPNAEEFMVYDIEDCVSSLFLHSLHS